MKEDWRWKIGEVVERIRTRYDHIGRKTGAPFLALLYPPEVETAALREWRTLAGSLAPDFEVVTVDVLEITQRSLDELGIENVVAALQDPMPGSNPGAELAHHWVHAVADAVRESSRGRAKRTVVSLERVAALHPVAGPRDVMQQLWDSAQSALEGPVIVLIPGSLRGPRTYAFLDDRNEFMYRGDLL
jgi:hypothetical protein